MVVFSPNNFSCIIAMNLRAAGTIWRYAEKINCQIFFCGFTSFDVSKVDKKNSPAGVHLMLKATKKAHCAMESWSFLAFDVLLMQLTFANFMKNCNSFAPPIKAYNACTASNWLTEAFTELVIELRWSLFTSLNFKSAEYFTPVYKRYSFGCRFDEAEMMALVLKTRPPIATYFKKIETVRSMIYPTVLWIRINSQ